MVLFRDKPADRLLQPYNIDGGSRLDPIPLGLVSNGAPIGQWPTDPAYTAGMPSNGEQSAGRFFSYIPGPSNGQYKLAAKMESLQYSQEGANDTESSDGGTDPAIYEQGFRTSRSDFL